MNLMNRFNHCTKIKGYEQKMRSILGLGQTFSTYRKKKLQLPVCGKTHFTDISKVSLRIFKKVSPVVYIFHLLLGMALIFIFFFPTK